YDSYIGTYYEQDRGYAKLAYFFGGTFLLLVEGGVGPVVYPANTGVAGLGTNGPDIRIDGTLFAEYRIKDYFGVNATLRYNNNISNTTITAGGVGDSLQYQEFEAYLGVRWLM